MLNDFPFILLKWGCAFLLFSAVFSEYLETQHLQKETSFGKRKFLQRMEEKIIVFSFILSFAFIFCLHLLFLSCGDTHKTFVNSFRDPSIPGLDQHQRQIRRQGKLWRVSEGRTKTGTSWKEKDWSFFQKHSLDHAGEEPDRYGYF